ncbi:MAG: hypothetical protein JWQ97_2730 [Phenylobacterium sp.]|nr:hypothetical protein [Phenylobacterium sp.]
MIRALVIVAIGGFLVSLVCLSVACAIGGPEAIARGAWGWQAGSHHFGMWRHMDVDAGPETRRDFSWSGGDTLEVNAPARIDYVQAAGPAKLTISGPAEALDKVTVAGGKITLADGLPHGRELHITLSAPSVKRFELNGAGKLGITGYKQDELSVVISGHAQVDAEGEARTVNLNLSGAGGADFGKLKAKGADIDISGAGDVTAAPTDWARVRIAGVGDVDLLTRPPRLETHIAGAGRIRQPGDNDAAAAGADDDDAGPARAT